MRPRGSLPGLTVTGSAPDAGGTATAAESRAQSSTGSTLPYERIDSQQLAKSIHLQAGERLLVLQPFGWHIDGHHIPNAAEHFSREGVCEDHGWAVVCDYGPYVAIVKTSEPKRRGGLTGARRAGCRYRSW